MYRLAADLVALFHALVIVTIIVGSLAAAAGLLRRQPRLAAALSVLLLMLVLSDVLASVCLLTEWEKQLRNLDLPGSAYRGSYIGHYFRFVPPAVHAYVGPAIVVIGLLGVPFWWILDRVARRRHRDREGA